MGPFWTQLFSGDTPPALLTQALDELPSAGDGDLGQGFHALSTWLAGWASRQHDEGTKRDRAAGFRKPSHESAWAWRIPFVDKQCNALLSPDEMAFVDACLDRGLYSGQKLPGIPCDAIELAFRRGVPNLFQALVLAPNAPSVESLARRQVDGPNGEAVPWLVWAARHGDGRFVSALLAKGLDPQASTAHGETALFDCKTAQAVDALLKAGCPFEQLSNSNRSVLAHWFSPSGGLYGHQASAIEAPEGRLAELGLGLSRFAPVPSNFSDAQKMAQGFIDVGWVLPKVEVTEGGKAWPLSTFLARKALMPETRVQQLLPLIHVAARQGFLADSAVATQRGWPDRGWIALALFHRLTTDWAPDEPAGWWNRVSPVVGKGFELGTDWWFDPAVLADALLVTQKLKLSKNRSRQGPVNQAWGAWLGRVWSAWEAGSSGPSEEQVCQVFERLRTSGVVLSKYVCHDFMARCPGHALTRLTFLCGLDGFKLSLAEAQSLSRTLGQGPIAPSVPLPLLNRTLALLHPISSELAVPVRAAIMEKSLTSPSPGGARVRF